MPYECTCPGYPRLASADLQRGRDTDRDVATPAPEVLGAQLEAVLPLFLVLVRLAQLPRHHTDTRLILRQPLP
eukprot:37259-Rhodomonas_salina.1